MSAMYNISMLYGNVIGHQRQGLFPCFDDIKSPPQKPLQKFYFKLKY
jgi:hypothetical protein